jgi:trigger factor
VRQQYGNEIRREVLGEAVNKQFATVVSNNKLRVAGNPNIDVKPNEMDEELLFVATFEIFPEIELQDYSSITIEKPLAEVSEADVDRMVEVFRKQQVTWETVSRVAADGDRVIADYTGIKDGVPFEGGSATDATIEIGAKRMIPGFEEAMIGLKAGDEKTAPVTFPETYHNEALKGATVDFKFVVKEVQGAVLPELNAEFFASFGVGTGDEAGFRNEIRQNMARELKNAVKNRIKTQVMDGIVAAHGEMHVPSNLVQDEINVLRQQMLAQFNMPGQQINAEELLPDDMFKEQGIRRVKLGLIVNELINKLAIRPEPSRVKETIEEIASTYENPQEVVNHYYGNEQQLRSIQALVLEDTVVENLLAKATVNDVASSYESVMAANAQNR